MMATFSKLKLGDKVQIHKDTYKISGIDSYQLRNFLDGLKKWKSYSLLGKNKRWLTIGVTDKPIVWQEEKKITVQKALIKGVINLEYSGLAQVGFEGTQGFSEPSAETLVFQDNSLRQIFAIERFLRDNEIKTYYFTGTQISN